MYGNDIPNLTATVVSSLLACWGKTAGDEQGSDVYHPAIYHMLDVGNVARVLLSEPASPRWRQTLGRILGLDPDQTAVLLPYLIALHDIGKISGSFQGKVAAQATRLTAAGFSLGRAVGTVALSSSDSGNRPGSVEYGARAGSWPGKHARSIRCAMR